MTSEPNKDMAAEVLSRVHAGDCRRRSRWYFITRTFLWGAFVLSLAASASLIASFIIFNEYVSGENHLLSFGWRGAMAFLTILPWSLILLEILLLVSLEMAARRFSFGYRTPILYLFGGIIAFGVFIAALINTTPIHQMLLDKADHDDLPVVGHWYKAVHDSHESAGVFRGVIVSVATNTFVVAHNDLDNDPDDGVKIVLLPRSIQAAAFHVGDRVIIAGDATNSMIQAYGIERW